MNNKILARIVSAVMVVAMLGTVGFAAEVKVDTAVVSGAQTLMAFVVDAADAKGGASNDYVVSDTNDIIALEQGTELSFDGKFRDDVTLAEGDQIWVRYWNGSTTTTVSVYEEPAEEVEPTVVSAMKVEMATILNEITIGEITYKNVLAVEYKLDRTDLPAGATVNGFGIHFGKYSDNTDLSGLTNETIDNDADGYVERFTNEVEVTGTGNVSYTAVIFGVDTENAGIKEVDARTFVNYSYTKVVEEN